MTKPLLYLLHKKPLVAGHEALAEYIDANIQRPVIAKVHRGLFTDPMNSSDSTSELKEQWAKVLTDALKVYTPIVIGYGGGDRSLMEFLTSAELKNSIYWCVYGKEKPSNDMLSFLMDKDGFMIETGGFDSVMHDLGKYDEAIADCNRAIELNPDLAEVYRNRAEVYRVIGELDKAEADEVRADEIDKKS